MRRLLRHIAGTLSAALTVGVVVVLTTPAAAQPTPSLQVLPSTNVRDGQPVLVKATGLAGAPYAVLECLRPFERGLLPLDCTQVGTLHPIFGQAMGFVRVRQDVGPAPGPSPIGTFAHNCQTALVLADGPCELVIGSAITTDSSGNVTGIEATAPLQFRRVLTVPTYEVTDGQQLPVTVSLAHPVVGPLEVAECHIGEGLTACGPVTTTTAWARVYGPGRPTFGTTVTLTLSRDVNGQPCTADPWYAYCLVVAGRGGIGTPTGQILGLGSITFAPGS